MEMTAERRARMSAAGRLGAAVMHSRHDARVTTAAARATFEAGFEHQVDPDGTLPAAERKRRAAHARKAYYLRLAKHARKAQGGKRDQLGRWALIGKSTPRK